MYLALLLNLITGLFFLIGIVVLKKTKNKEKVSVFTFSLSFMVLGGLVLFHLLPELISTKDFYLTIPVICGFLLILFLDKLIPHHHHEHHDGKCDKDDHKLHINHIGLMTILGLTIHNIIEGITLYNVTAKSIISGIFLMLSISLHNIPLGFQIGNAFKEEQNSKLLIFILCISPLLGALLMIIFGTLYDSVLNILLALSFGMLLYILLFELFSEVRHSYLKKEAKYGIVLGLIIVLVMLFI